MTVLDNNAGSQAFSNIGKFGITAAFAVNYLYAAEIFPTVLRYIPQSLLVSLCKLLYFRATGIGSSATCARLGSFVAPFIANYLGEINRVIPFATFGALSLVAGAITLLLPETGGKKLPDTIEEGKTLKVSGSSFLTTKMYFNCR